MVVDGIINYTCMILRQVHCVQVCQPEYAHGCYSIKDSLNRARKNSSIIIKKQIETLLFISVVSLARTKSV